MFQTKRLPVLVAAAFAAAACSRTGVEASAVSSPAAACKVTHGTFTTFDATKGGCLNDTNGVNCNQYATKDDVYLSGGPVSNELTAGQTYFFAIIAPGAQNGGFVDGADGNLSDAVAKAAPDLGSGKPVDPARTFQIGSNGEITSLDSTVVPGTAPDGKVALPVGPFDDTPNGGGVYVLAICKAGATDACGCKYDTFKIGAGPAPVETTVGKYYDANVNGTWDEGEAPVPGWLIDYHDGIAGTFPPTGADGLSKLFLPPDTYTFAEEQATSCPVKFGGMAIPAWLQTGPKPDLVYTDVVIGEVPAAGDVTANCTTPDLFFGNVCLGKAGAHTLGFWSNKNGQGLTTAEDVAALAAANLVKGGAVAFDPTDKAQVPPFLLKATATDMSYMLSAQLAAMILNARHLVSPDAFIYAPKVFETAPSDVTLPGTAPLLTLERLIELANAELGAHPTAIDAGAIRTYQEALKNALDAGNNDLTFVQPTLATCPAPVFTPQLCQ